jgi:hypothetical protein
MDAATGREGTGARRFADVAFSNSQAMPHSAGISSTWRRLNGNR